MRWLDSNVRTAAYFERIKPWAPWFAWYPIQIDQHWIWLEKVERRGRPRWAMLRRDKTTTWEHREIKHVDLKEPA